MIGISKPMFSEDLFEVRVSLEMYTVIYLISNCQLIVFICAIFCMGLFHYYLLHELIFFPSVLKKKKNRNIITSIILNRTSSAIVNDNNNNNNNNNNIL